MEVIMNSCMFYSILFELIAIIKLIGNIVSVFKEDTGEKTIINDLSFWVLQGFAVVLLQLDKIIQLLEN